jgi:hypothetical protein
MDDAVFKLIAVGAVILAVVFDWPRALAGVAIGVVCRRSDYKWLVIPAGVVLVAALGEVIYPLIGWAHEASWGSFSLGLIAAGATAAGLFRVLYHVADTAEG